MSRFRFLIALVFVVGTAFGDAVYTYTGGPFDTISGDPGYLASPPFKLGDSIDLIVDFAEPLAPDLVNQTVIPVSWSFKLGTSDFVPVDFGILESSKFSTDSSGKIDDWFFSFFDSPRGFSTSGTAGDEAFQLAAHDFAGTTSTEMIGTWTTPAAVPEPSTVNLLILGAALVFFAKRGSHV